MPKTLEDMLKELTFAGATDIIERILSSGMIEMEHGEDGFHDTEFVKSIISNVNDAKALAIHFSHEDPKLSGELMNAKDAGVILYAALYYLWMVSKDMTMPERNAGVN